MKLGIVASGYGPPVGGGSLTLTAGASGGSATNGSVSATTASYTPVASSTCLLYVSFGLTGTIGTLLESITSTSGLTFTSVVRSTGAHSFGSPYLQYHGLYRAEVGASPSAHTITFTPFASSVIGFITMHAFSAKTSLGGNVTVVQNAPINTAGSGSTVLTLTGAPSAANTVISLIGGNVDTPFQVQAAISGQIALMNPVPTTYDVGAVFYSTGTTNQVVTQTAAGIGPSMSARGGIIAELLAA
jgi:hypothetical protein